MVRCAPRSARRRRLPRFSQLRLSMAAPEEMTHVPRPLRPSCAPGTPFEDLFSGPKKPGPGRFGGGQRRPVSSDDVIDVSFERLDD